MGHRHLPSMATITSRLPLTGQSTRPLRPEEPPPALESPPPSDTGRPVIPTYNNQASQSASTGFIRPDQAVRKIEASRP